MMDIRQLIVKKIDEISSVTEKNMLREVMEHIFIPMVDYTESQLSRLEQRVKDQIPWDVNSFVLFSTLMTRATAQGSCPYLFPMLEEDLSPPVLAVSEMQNRLQEGQSVRLDTVFVQADYLVCKEIENSETVFFGILKTDQGDFKIQMRLQLSERYFACIENLYRLFLSNSLPWQTVNAPYLFKMFDVMLVSMQVDSCHENANVQDYQVSYGDYDGFVCRGLVPVWNISKRTVKTEDFPLAALDKVNYEYVLDLHEEGIDHGYLADYGSADISAVRREENALIVTSPVPKGLLWDMYKVMKRRVYETDSFEYPLMNNGQQDSFSGRMRANYGTMIKTYAELHRLLSSYDVAGYLELNSVEVCAGSITGETYEVNTFLTDEVRDLAVSKSLLLKFTPSTKELYLNRDLMSFLVSQVQLIYPEFYCVGVLL